MLESTPHCSSQSLGACERANRTCEGHIRTLRLWCESVLGATLEITENAMAWLVRHAGWLTVRFLIKSDGKSAYQRLKGKAYTGEVVPLFELVWFHLPDRKQAKLEVRWDDGLWIGKTDRNDEHIVATPDGKATVTTRAVRRKPPSKRFSGEQVKALQAAPWETKIKEVKLVEPRRRYITWTLIQRFGGSPGCKGCYGGQIHTDVRRERFEKFIAKREKAAEEKIDRLLGLPVGPARSSKRHRREASARSRDGARAAASVRGDAAVDFGVDEK